MDKNLETLVRKTAEYIIGLPDGDRTTIALAVENAAGSDLWDGDDNILMRIHEDIIEEVGKSGVVLDFSSHSGRVEGLPYNLDFVVRRP